METKYNGGPDREDPQAKRQHPESEHLQELSGINEDQSGNNLPEEHREQRRHHQEHGNRKYRMFSNHASSDDQPFTRTDTTP